VADAVVSRGRSSELLSLLRAAEHHGLTTFHPAAGIAAVQNKARLASRLEAGGVPMLEAAVGNGHALLRFADVEGPRQTLAAAGRRIWITDHGSRGFVELEADPAGDAFATYRIRTLAMQCGWLLGLELFGVECVLTTDGPQVMDVLDFPGYEGVPGASAALAEQVIRSLERRGQ
jgi:glutathione synthase/RimK-type ligase-like ATP-grasp enzyme